MATMLRRVHALSQEGSGSSGQNSCDRDSCTTIGKRKNTQKTKFTLGEVDNLRKRIASDFPVLTPLVKGIVVAPIEGVIKEGKNRYGGLFLGLEDNVILLASGPGDGTLFPHNTAAGHLLHEYLHAAEASLAGAMTLADSAKLQKDRYGGHNPSITEFGNQYESYLDGKRDSLPEINELLSGMRK